MILPKVKIVRTVKKIVAVFRAKSVRVAPAKRLPVAATGSVKQKKGKIARTVIRIADVNQGIYAMRESARKPKAVGMERVKVIRGRPVLPVQLTARARTGRFAEVVSVSKLTRMLFHVLSRIKLFSVM